MNNFRSFLTAALTASALLVLGCGSKTTASSADNDSGVQADSGEVVEYKGVTSNGSIPENVPEDPPWDSGNNDPFVYDSTCCTLTFAIADSEPPGATGTLRGSGSWAANGLVLTRANGQWSVTACVPADSQSMYWYEIVSPAQDTSPVDADAVDSGSAASETDAGSADAGPTTVTTYRVDDVQPKDYDGSGHQVNLLVTKPGCK